MLLQNVVNIINDCYITTNHPSSLPYNNFINVVIVYKYTIEYLMLIIGPVLKLGSSDHALVSSRTVAHDREATTNDPSHIFLQID